MLSMFSLKHYAGHSSISYQQTITNGVHTPWYLGTLVLVYIWIVPSFEVESENPLKIRGNDENWEGFRIYVYE
jgi:hypothetical protein